MSYKDNITEKLEIEKMHNVLCPRNVHEFLIALGYIYDMKKRSMKQIVVSMKTFSKCRNSHILRNTRQNPVPLE